MQKLKKILKKIFWPNWFWGILFYSNWIGLYFFMLDEWNRTLNNFLNWSIIVFVMYFPFYLLSADDENPGLLNQFQWFQKFVIFFNNNKLFQWIFIICYLILIVWVLDRFSINT
jgi:hypothetical protein